MNIYWIVFALAALIAVTVRVAMFAEVPGGVNQDEAMAAVDAKALADFGTDRLGMSYPVHFQAWGFGQMSVLMSYLMVPFIKLFGFSTAVIRLPTLIASLLGLVFLFLFCRDSFNRDFALIVFLFAAINPWHIVQSRWALDCNLFPHVLMCAVYLLNHGIKYQKPVFMYTSMIVFGLSMYCYGVSIYTVPLILVMSCVVFMVQKKVSGMECLICIACYILIAWPFIATMFINAFGLETFNIGKFTIPYFEDSIRSSDILFFSDNFFPQLWQNIQCLFYVIFQIGDDYLCNVVPGFSTLYVCSIPFMLIGICWMFKNWKCKSGTLLLTIIFIISIFNGLITSNVNVNRMNIIFYCLIILTCFGIYSVLKNVKYADVAVEVIFTISFTMFCATYFTTYSDDIAVTFQKDFGQALSALDTDKYDKIIITPDVQDKNRWYVSEIYTLYYCDIDAEEYNSEDFDRKYTFANPSEIYVDSNQDAAYVISKDDIYLFDDSTFDTKTYGRYVLATPKNSD